MAATLLQKHAWVKQNIKNFAQILSQSKLAVMNMETLYNNVL